MNVSSKFIYKLLVVTMLLISFLVTPINVYATDTANTYKLTDVDITITTPVNTNVITRENKNTDEIFNQVMSYEDAQTYMNNNDVYLIATAFDFSYTIDVQMKKTTEKDDKYLNEKLTNDTTNTNLKKETINKTNYYMYNSSSLDENNSTLYSINATTFQNQKEITLKLITNSSEISDDQIAIFNDMIKSTTYPVSSTIVNTQPTITIQTENKVNNKIDMASILIQLLISIILLVIIFTVIIYVKTNKKNFINIQVKNNSKNNKNTFIDDFYDEVSSQNKKPIDKVVASTKNQPKIDDSKHQKSIKLEIEVPADKIRTTNKSARIKRKLENDNSIAQQFETDDFWNKYK